MLEVLSENRDLTHAVKEAEKMFSDIDITRLPSYEIGLESGLEQGMEQGIEKGLEKGISQGEKKSQIVVAKRMLNQLTDEDIVHFTQLSLDVVQQLRKQSTKD
jgi:flagellar biosynthesis/type III secretory pathway protein FliH